MNIKNRSFIPKDERVPKLRLDSKGVSHSSFIPKDERVPKSDSWMTSI